MAFKWIYTKKEVEKRVKELAEKMKNTLTEQGHVASGNLRNSVKARTDFNRGRNIRATVKAYSRGEKLDKKQVAQFIKISDILRWMSFKESSSIGGGFSYKDENDRRRVAHAIRKEIKLRGTRTSFRGKSKIGWITKNYDRFSMDIDKKLEQPIGQDFERLLDRVLTKLAAENKDIIYLK